MRKLNMIKDGERAGGYIEGGDPATTFHCLWQWLLDEYEPKAVFDVGCAEGHTMQWFIDQGLSVTGIDLSELAISNNHNPRAYVWDLEARPYLSQADLVWCAEVVEHIDPKAIDNLMQTLTQGKVCCMTHAVPGQGGHHHVNEQFAPYWIDQFNRYGWTLDHHATVASYEIAENDCKDWVNFWLQSGMIFVPEGEQWT